MTPPCTHPGVPFHLPPSLCPERLTPKPTGAVDRQLTATATVPAGSLLVEVPAALQLRYDRLPAGDAPYLERLFALMPRGSDTGAPAWQFKQALVLLHHVAKVRSV